MKQRTRTTLVLAAGILLLATACATHSATLNTYVRPTFQPGNINQVAVFPIRNARLAPSEANQINRKISMGLHGRNPELRIMSQAEAVSLLNEKGLADDWAAFIENYTMSGVPDANKLREIGSALGVDAIIQGVVVHIFQQDGQWGMYGTGNKGATRVTVRFSMLGVEEGALLWQASSDGLRETASNLSSAPPIIEAVNLAVDKIVSALPNM